MFLFISIKVIKRKFLEEFTSFCKEIEKFLIVMGDFNEIVFLEDKLGGLISINERF